MRLGVFESDPRSKIYAQAYCEDELLKRLSMSRRRLGQISYRLLKNLSTSKQENQIDSGQFYEGNLENFPDPTVDAGAHAQKQLFLLRQALLASSNRDKILDRPTVRFNTESNLIHKIAASAVLHGLDGRSLSEDLQRETCVKFDLHAPSKNKRSRQKELNKAPIVVKASHFVVVTFGVPFI